MSDIVKGTSIKEKAGFFEKPAVFEKKIQDLSLDWRVLIPPAALAFVLLIHKAVPAHSAYKVKQFPYFTWLLYVLIGVLGILAVLSLILPKRREKLAFKSWFLGPAFCFWGSTTSLPSS